MANIFRLAVYANRFPFFVAETKLCSYYHFVPKRSKRFTYQFFIIIRPIYFGRVKKVYTLFHCFADKNDHIFLFRKGRIGKCHSHTTQANGGHFKAVTSQFSLLHFFHKNYLNYTAKLDRCEGRK